MVLDAGHLSLNNQVHPKVLRINASGLDIICLIAPTKSIGLC